MSRFTAYMLALIVLVPSWLAFAYLMRDTNLVEPILGWGAALLVGFVFVLADS